MDGFIQDKVLGLFDKLIAKVNQSSIYKSMSTATLLAMCLKEFMVIKLGYFP
jgi:hypothetical protein